MWRWDQGRLTYFSLDKIRKIAFALDSLNGIDLTLPGDPLRSTLEVVVGLPFAPSRYRVWRNYARVFKVLGLASKIGNRLVVTDLCKKMVSNEDDYLTYDDYIQYIAKSFYFPSPVFQGYDVASRQCFPFCSIFKLLISRGLRKGEPFMELNDVFSYLIGNDVQGNEPVAFYSGLKKSSLTGSGDHLRQVREMLIFVSQLSYLSWIDGKLFIDVGVLSDLSIKELEDFTKPIVRPRDSNLEREIQNIFAFSEKVDAALSLPDSTSIEDIVFTEGKKIRVSHLRTERNRRIIAYYFENCKNPKLCDVCDIEVANRYPWLSNLIEVHHILPLSSPLHVSRSGTSLNDLVGLCPNCHRATHAYYKYYFTNQGINDFSSEEHAKIVYLQVKSKFIYI